MENDRNKDGQGRPPKLAWVTGASSGIGRALCLRLAQDGWTVAASARNAAALQELAILEPGRICPVPLDVTDRKATSAALAGIEGKIAPVTLAVFGAGTYKPETVESFHAETIAEMVDLNLMGTVNCLDEMIPRMIARGSGRIAVMASVSGYTGLPGAAGYGATKAALINMCQSLHPGLQRHGVGISVINPGFVDTPLTRKNDFPMPFLISAEEAAEQIARGLASGKFEIVFPWRMKVAMKLLQALPARLRFALTRRMLRRD